MPLKELTRKITVSKDFPGGISSLPEKEEIIQKINEIILFVNALEKKIETIHKGK